MSLQEIKEQAFNLSPNERLALVNFIVESLQAELSLQTNQTQTEQASVYIPGSSIKGKLGAEQERTALISRMRGFLKTDKSAPTDPEVEGMLEERLVEKYLR
ncbi:MAG: hypothetical protein V7L14_22225 [Nostoc sp.]|uniref:hypothetical protein n=1 Tax=Nostoc sp. TaxID=1180 RepID=UPI002FF8A8D4